MYSVEDWSEVTMENDTKAVHAKFAVVDLNQSILNLDGEIEYGCICICPNKENAVKLVHMMNRA